MTTRQNNMVSIDNGNTWHTADSVRDGAIEDSDLRRRWDALVNAMDDDARERTHDFVAPSDHRTFLAAYLRTANANLVIG